MDGSLSTSAPSRKTYDSVEFAATFSDRFTVVSDENSAITGEAPNQSEMIPETDNDRPHNRPDDSNASVSGTCQTNLQALCTYASINWASEIVLYEAPNPCQTLTTVSNK